MPPRPSGGVGKFRVSKVICASPKSSVLCSVLGVSWSSFHANFPPVEETSEGQPVRPRPHAQMSISCTPWLPISPLPVSQNHCQLYANLFLLYGFHCVGPRNLSQSRPRSTRSSG